MAYIGDKFASASGSMRAMTPSVVSRIALSGNNNRSGGSFYNDSAATCYLGFAETVSTGSYTVKLVDQAYYEFSRVIYTGTVAVIWTTAITTGSLFITELY
jgi:hypothetical protein